MSFDAVRLPENVERGVSGGPVFNTTVHQLASGQEQRNQNWSSPRGEWDIGYGIQNKTDLIIVQAFFYARAGMARGFLFKDWSDFQVESPLQFATGDGSATEFQLSRWYTSGNQVFERAITRPIESTIKVYFGEVEQTSGWSIDDATGLITFSVAPDQDEVIQWTGEWDVPVRFNTDSLNISMEIFYAGTIPQIPIIELKTAE